MKENNSKFIYNRKGSVFLFCICVLCFVMQSFSQKTVTGQVLHPSGEPIPGVNIIVKGTNIGASTDFDGNYEIIVEENNILLFSYIGFNDLEERVEKRKVINVVLEEDAEGLEQVVLIGYGSQRKLDVNGSISTIKIKDIADVPQPTVDQLLQGRAAGVTVTQNSGKPGGAISVKIRGLTSITGSNEPLYVIDGVPISGDSRNSSTSGRTDASAFGGNGQTGSSPLALLNPGDIESIDILKDASATAIYGSRGANGVVIIKTKNGKKGNIGNEDSKFNFSTFLTLQEPQKLLDVMDLPTYAVLQNELSDAYQVPRRPQLANPNLLGAGTDWQDAVFQQSVMKNYQLSYSGNTDKMNYLISGAYLEQEGTVIGSGFDRVTFRVNVEGNVKSWLRVGANITAGRTDEKITLNGDRNGVVSLSLLQAPEVAVRNADGTFAGPPSDPSANEGSINPVALALSITNKLRKHSALGNIFTEFDITNDLKFRNEIGGNFDFFTNSIFTPTYEWGRFINNNATLQEKRAENRFWIVKNYLSFNKTLNEIHNLSLLLGQEAQESSWNGTQVTGQGFVNNNVQTLNNAGEIVSSDSYKNSTTLNSYYGRAIYSLMGKYGLTATFRADGSSKFDGLGNNKWGYFPSFSASWKVYQEPWMENVNYVVDDLKLRVGYGVVGNQDIPNYLYGSSLDDVPTGLGLGFLVRNIPNPDLKWEETRQTNIGLDFTVFDSKLNATIDVYNKDSKDFLFQLPLPIYVTGPSGDEADLGGIRAPFVNLGSMNNRGIDVSLAFSTDPSRKFSWNTSLNFSHYKNEVTDLNQNSLEIIRSVNTSFLSTPVTRTVEGEAIGQFWGYKVKGLFRSQDDLTGAPVQFGIPFSDSLGDNYLGDVQYEDLNGDSIINEEDRTFIGNPHPDFTFGFNNNFRYQNFDLSIFLQGSYGNDILNLTRRESTSLARLFTNQLTEAQDFYTSDNIDAEFPRPRRGDDNQNLFISDRYVEDGSYLRIQNVTIGYSLSDDLIRTLGIRKFRVYGTINNLYTFTDYTGYDPEIGSFNGDALQMGIDRGRYPSARTFTFGVNAEF
ncbi:SusC/RagA family TonB-linked outer membrane protein [Aquimarina latercula]|uniref:SusC/RagA family TonB-linked outer membrane protein n=1 Tax=Aquimarina latercula TaxID=987 RepID=UPI00047F5D1B|nr:TonB-dependent receptor [Aquimarina latercula]